MHISRYTHEGRTRYARRLDDGTWQPISNPFDGEPIDTGQPIAADQLEFAAPCEPSIIIAAAVNYQSHAIKRQPTDKPELFFKPASSVIGPGANIVLPEDAGLVEVEGELVAVVGKTARNVTVAEAADFILGYTCGMDVSARDWQRADRQFWRAKGCDTFSPIGPVIATGLDPAALTLTTTVNGEVRQQTEVSELLYSVHELLAFTSRHMTLQPGDVIFTGTPGRTPQISAGDVMEVTISGIGTLTNPVTTSSPTQ